MDFGDLSDRRKGTKALAVPEKPRFSFILPVYDRTQKLREGIRSLLAQTFAAFEVVIVTDGSPDSTMHVLWEFKDDPRVRIFSYSDNSGNACRGRNKGIEIAVGEFVSFHDSDDIAHPERLTRTWKTIRDFNCDAVYGPTKIISDGTRKIEGIYNGQVFDPPEFDFEVLKKTNLMMTCSVTVRRSLLLEFGAFRPEMRYREDHELWLRLAHNRCRWKRSPDILSYYRLHSGNAELHLRGDDALWYARALHLYAEDYYGNFA